MADSELTPPPEPTPRPGGLARGRKDLPRNVLIGVAIALVVVLAALWFSDTIRIPTDKPHLAGGAEPTQADARRPNGAVETVTEARRALNPLQPLRLWIGGDSLAGALGPSLGRMTAATGVVQPQYDSRISTGLMSGDVDWPEHAAEELNRLNPEVVVFMIGTNDARIYNESQAQEYAMLTDQMMRVLIGTGREVYWVNAPVMEDPDLEANVKLVDEIQREVAARFPKNVTLIDAHTLFADEQGEYQSSILDESGDRVSMRAGDGIHLTGAGGDHLAQPIFTLLDARWKIEDQADPLHPKKVLVTRGSTQVPGSESGSTGTYRSSSSGSGSSSRGSSWTPNSRGLSPSTSTIATTGTTSPPATTPTTADPPPSSTPPSTAPGG